MGQSICKETRAGGSGEIKGQGKGASEMVIDKEQAAVHRMMSPLNLAFVGDGVYSLLVREYLATKGNIPVGRLHQRAVAMVCAPAQSQAIEALLPLLTPEEERIYKRGRNARSSSVPRHADPVQYRRATGLEALFGYLYLSGEEGRLRELFAAAVAACMSLLDKPTI